MISRLKVMLQNKELLTSLWKWKVRKAVLISLLRRKKNNYLLFLSLPQERRHLLLCKTSRQKDLMKKLESTVKVHQTSFSQKPSVSLPRMDQSKKLIVKLNVVQGFWREMNLEELKLVVWKF